MTATPHAPLPYDTLEIGANTASAGMQIYLTDPSGRKIGVVWGKAGEKAYTAHLLISAANAHHELIAALETAIKVAGEARDEWDRAPNGMKAGKLLVALAGSPKLNYRADITGMHETLARVRALDVSGAPVEPAKAGAA
jgi:hypothetical protein